MERDDERSDEERDEDDSGENGEQESGGEGDEQREGSDQGDREEDDSGAEDDSGDDDEQESGGEAARPSISAKEMTQAAMEALRDLTGHDPEAATGLMWDGESWLVTVDVLELSRIPNTTDLLATYVVQLDGDGNLSGYKRTRRFQRSQAEEG